MEDLISQKEMSIFSEKDMTVPSNAAVSSHVMEHGHDIASGDHREKAEYMGRNLFGQ